MQMSPDRFDALAAEALDAIPPALLDLLDNVVFFVEDDAPADQPDLLGLYEGVPLTERALDWCAPLLPDRITLYREPILRMCADEEEVRDEVRITVVHEVAHHFGIEDARLHELGWG